MVENTDLMNTTTRYGKGALPCQMIKQFINTGFITGVSDPGNQIQPASLDLSLSDEIYEVVGSLIPKEGETVRETLTSLGRRKHSINKPLEIGKVYVVRLNEKFDIPENVYGYCNPKSSTGRVDTHVRLLANGYNRYDGLPKGKGYKGEVWLSIIPKSFRIIVSPGLSMNQMRFFTTDTRFNELELEVSVRSDRLIWDPDQERPLSYDQVQTPDNDGSVILGLGIAHDNVGWKAKKTDEVIDLSKRDHDPKVFWEVLEPQNGHFFLESNGFYILATHEGVRIPPHLAAEIVPMTERCGEFRSHYAGFFDPGWGWGENGGGNGDIATLEIRPFENLVVRHGHPICKFQFERMIEEPDGTYHGNYFGQRGPRLSKHFGPWS